MSGKFDFYLSIAHDKGLCALVKRCNHRSIQVFTEYITDAEFTIELKLPIERMVICDEIDRTFGNGQLTFAYLMQRNKLEQEIKEQAGGKK